MGVRREYQVYGSERLAVDGIAPRREQDRRASAEAANERAMPCCSAALVVTGRRSQSASA